MVCRFLIRPLICEKLCKNLQKLENSGNLITSVNIEDVMVDESRSRLIKPIITRSEINQKFRHSMTHVDPRHLRNRLLKLWCFEVIRFRNCFLFSVFYDDFSLFYAENNILIMAMCLLLRTLVFN